jgi:hypothetical protein
MARRAVRTAAVVGTAAAVGSRAAKSQAPPPAPQAEAAATAGEPLQVAPAPSTAPEDIEQLKQLAGLKDQGVLTEQEFAAEKAKILGS